MQEGTLYAAKLHHRKDVWGPDAYARLPATRLRGQDKANFRSPLAALASICLHIVFGTSQRHSKRCGECRSIRYPFDHKR